ncbi:hypothetical protein SAMN02910356_00891 [Selenomonas sp. GACV-9]|uniref:hypothetical protein n=1 Tax=Selenomonas sp. GACV-9 TaxID=3158782 RepID=UPI0008E6FE48|nr:hypothetical protein SAMN02910356_00891 [Selenomonas ruminantium]
MRKDRQKGFVVLEAAVSLPMLALLLTAAGAMVLWSIKYYFVVMADAELHQEVQIAFERVVEDALESKAIEPNCTFDYGYDFCKRSYVLTPVEAQEIRKVYWINLVEDTCKLVEGSDASAPMTGDSAMAEVTIRDFSCQEVSGHKGLYIIKLSGQSQRTGHVYTLETAVYLSLGRE